MVRATTGGGSSIAGTSRVAAGGSRRTTGPALRRNCSQLNDGIGTRRSVASRAPRRATRPAVRHSLADSPSASRVSVPASASPIVHIMSAPTGPSTRCPTARPTEASSRPIAPPSPATVGQASVGGVGKPANTAASTGSAASIAASRAAMLPSPRRDAIRHAQASIVRPGSAPATPKPCSSRSASTAPTGPARLLVWREVAVLSEGSRGS